MKNENPSGISLAGSHSSGTLTEDTWIDKQEIMMRLHISNRTLQTWRSKGVLPFARIRKKIYYKESDLKNLLITSSRQGQNVIHSREKYGNSS